MESKYVIVKDNSYYHRGTIVADCNGLKFIKMISDDEGITILAQQLEFVNEDYKVLDFVFNNDDALFEVFNPLCDIKEIKETDTKNNVHAISFYGDKNSVTLSMSQNLDLSLGDVVKLKTIPIKVCIDVNSPNYDMFLKAYNLVRTKTNHEPIIQKVKVNHKG